MVERRREVPVTARFVATATGNDGNAGTLASPWKTINRGTQGPEVQPGDSIGVLPGTYNEEVHCTRPGAAGRFVSLYSTVARGALIRSPANAYSAIQLATPYWDVFGFDVQCGAGYGSGIDNTANAPKSHHLSVRQNYVRDCPGGGINLAWGDRYYIGGNEVSRNAGLNTYQTSGITIYQPQDSGDATPGWRNVVEGNWSHDNAETMPGNHTDGNGLIFDDFHNGQQNGHQTVPYPFGALARWNLLTNNGGSGAHSAWSDFIEYDENTLAGNYRDNSNLATWRGGLMALFSSQNTARGNLCLANSALNLANTAIMWGQSPTGILDSNLTFDVAKPGTNSFGIDTNTPVITRQRYGINPLLGADWLPTAAAAIGLGAPRFLAAVAPSPVATLPADVRAALVKILQDYP